MSLRTYAIPLALVSLGIGLGVISDRPAQTAEFADPVADVVSAPPEAAQTEAVQISADLANDLHYAGSAPTPAPEMAEAQTLEIEPPPIPIADGSLDEPIPADSAEVPIEIPTEEFAVDDAPLPDGILPDGVVEGQPYPPVDGEAPYQVVTTNPMACVPEGAPGCSTGAYCCGELVCVEDSCIQTH